MLGFLSPQRGKADFLSSFRNGGNIFQWNRGQSSIEFQFPISNLYFSNRYAMIQFVVALSPSM